MQVAGRGDVVLGGEKMEEVKGFKYLGRALSKYGDMEKEVSERVMKSRSVIEFGWAMKGKNISMEGKERLKE